MNQDKHNNYSISTIY